MIWSWNASPIQEAVVSASALLLAAIGLIVLLRRGHWLTTLLFASAFLSLAAFQAGTLGLVHADGTASARLWATYLARVSALVSWLWLTLSVVLGRPEPRAQLRNAGAPLVLSLIGCTILSSTANTRFVVQEVVGNGPGAVVVFGALGKIYLMYLVVAMVGVLMNIESMQRVAPASGQRRLRALFIAILVSMLGELLVVSAGLLYGGLRVSWLVSTAPLLFVAGSAAAMALARRRLSDMDVPVARPVIYYSSVSLTLAGAFMLSTLVLSRLIPALSQEWRIGVIFGFVAFVGGGGLLLMLSPRTSRAIKRFIDRNFYANRYDYRREWERVSRDLTPTARPEELARQIETLVCAIFDAERATIHLRDDKAGVFRRLLGPEGVLLEVPPGDLLVKHLERTLLPVLLHDLEGDLDLIPLLVESRPTLVATDAAVCAPLAVGDALIGLLWVSRKRNGEEWSLEDLEFLGAMSRQVAAALWFSRQSELATEMRQMESLHRLTTFVLHDIKNQVSGLSLVVENAKRHLGNPDFQRDAMAVVGNTVASLRELMNQVSGVARVPHIEPAPCSVRELIEDAILAAGMAQIDGDGPLRLELRIPEQHEVVVDRRLLARVLVNLLTNAREALPGPGRIELAAEIEGEPRMLVVSVHDDGRGMNEEFLRTRLFRPFATTKPNGLGIGLAQSRSIVEAHGGRIEVRSRLGAGTTFTVHVPADGRVVHLHEPLDALKGLNP
ncbi:MAG: XrtA/PEP-CTERM system histidine kinase PrsK [Candidatus Eisenbacteria bacterium]